MRKRNVALVGLLGVALTAVPVSIAVGEGDDAADPSKIDSSVVFAQLPSARPPVKEVPADIAEAFAVFGKPAAQKAETSTQRSEFGVNRTLGRNVRTATGRSVVVLPGDGNLCLRITMDSGATGLSCATLEQATAGRLIISQREDDDAKVGSSIGVVPDGVASVTLTSADGRTSTAEVTDNVWSVDGSTAKSAALVTANGATVAKVDVP